MDRLTPLQTYKTFLALKQHFTQDRYDYIKYKGNVTASQESLDKRNDKYYFHRLAKIYSSQEQFQDYVIANLLAGNEWIGSFSDEHLLSYTKRRQSLAYTFGNDLDLVFADGAKEAFRVKSGEYPDFLLKHLQWKISIETMVIMNRFTAFSDVFDSKIGEKDFIWSKIKRRIIKYTPFLEYDADKMKTILKNKAFST
jgi:hypothetical protein